jgi:hypothetical protein
VKVVVYVEGAGDRLCLETLLAPLIRAKIATGVQVQFVEMTRGDRKTTLVTQVPLKAATAVLNDRNIIVVILPDLYPPNKGFPHTTCAQMEGGVRRLFRQSATDKRGWDDRLMDRFHVFCMIHDLEVLLLAAEEQMMAEAGLNSTKWHKPVEDQNHHTPPKRVVEQLVPGYQPTVDGPRILAAADYRVIANRSPNGFGRFVAYLESVS